MVRCAPAQVMRQPFALGCNPEVSGSRPASASSSGYAAISAMSRSRGMTPSLVALTVIMNRIVVSPFSFVLAGIVFFPRKTRGYTGNGCRYPFRR